MNEEDYVTLTDEQGNEVLYEVLLTFHSDEYGKDYILLSEPGVAENDPEQETEILAFTFEPNDEPESEEGELTPIEDEEEWNMVAEVLNTFVADDSLSTEEDAE
ncbi:MAG: DUF1292 domain-containing protein [Lactobacillaceae bacterium]|jgi:uncharacterized protein YrzB (UPF0473 family)|nr:DUF1292 domain-containing protein [Lactobacillaceae bacterium]